MPSDILESVFPVRQVVPPRDDHTVRDATTRTTRKVSFRHPAYRDERNHNILFSIPAFDGIHSGLHHGTALLACSIIACNVKHGYLTESRAGLRVQMGMDDILDATSYWFYVPRDESDSGSSAQTMTDDSAYAYPVCPSFDHWMFPHDSEPPNWPSYTSSEGMAEESGNTAYLPPPSISASNFSNNVLSRDRSCRVSGYRDFIEGAYLCPRSKLEWFRRNGMQLYNRNQMLQSSNQVDDIGNAIALRADIHDAFDARVFVIVRKGGKWTNHFLSATYDLGALYHNAEVTLDPGVAPAFILTRFAWAILPLISGAGFFDGETKLVRIWDEKKLQHVDQPLTVQDQERIFPSTKSRHQSPKKGKRVRSEEPDEESRRCKRNRSSAWHDDQVAFLASVETDHALSASDVAVDAQFSRSISSETSASSSMINSTLGLVPFDIMTATSDSVSKQPALSKDLDKSTTQMIFSSSTLTQAQKEQLLEADAMDHMRKRWCRIQRPTDDGLICCDYNRAELAERLGLVGPKEFSGAHLCSRCLGFGEDKV